MTMSSIFIISAGVWLRSERNNALIFERIQYEQQLRLLDGALRYAVTYAKYHFSTLEQEYERVVDISEYAHLLDPSYTIRVQFRPHKGLVYIKALLHKDSVPQEVLAMSCCVTRKCDTFGVSGWKIGTK